MIKAPTIIKQFGLHCSGTGYLRHLLLHNFHARVELLGYSVLGHRSECPTFEQIHEWLRSHPKCVDLQAVFHDIKFVISVRNPYTWAAEFMYYKAGKWSAYQVGRPRDYGKLITGWLNTRYRVWRKLCEDDPDRVVFVQYEDLCESYKEPLVEMAFRIGLEFNGNEFDDINKRVLSNGKLSRKPMHCRTPELKPGAEKWIERKVDWDAAGYFGYYK